MCFLAPGTGTQYWDRQAGHWQMDTQRMITTHHTYTVATVITINNLETFSSYNTFVWWFFKVHWVVYCWQWDKISTVLWNVVWLCVCVELLYTWYDSDTLVALAPKTGSCGCRDAAAADYLLYHLYIYRRWLTSMDGCKRKRPSSNIWLSPQASASSIDWPV